MDTSVEQYEQLREKAKSLSKELLESRLNDINYDEAENAQIIKDYEECDKKSKKLSVKRHLFGFLGILCKLVFTAGILYFIYNFVEFLNDTQNKSFMIMSISLFAGLIMLFFIYKFTLGKFLSKLDAELLEFSNTKNEIKRLAESHTFQFTGLISDLTFSSMLTQIMPNVKFDEDVSTKNQSKYNMTYTSLDKSAVIAFKTGSIEGNPFSFVTSRNTGSTKKTYTGRRVVNWSKVTKYTDGSKQTKNYSETLTGSIEKPAIRYLYSTHLLYYHEACDTLSFVRNPQKIKGDVDDFVQKAEKKQIKKFENAAYINKDYTPLSNTTFEALFETKDRSDEVNYRVFFSPVAQANLAKLIKLNNEVDNDFSYEKNNQVHKISNKTNAHDLVFGHQDIEDFDIIKVKEKFQQKFLEFFDQVFFSLTPILSIPDLNEKCDQLVDNDYSNFPPDAHEMLVNNLPNSFHSPKGCIPTTIAKTALIQKYENADHVAVRTTGYTISTAWDYASVKAKRDGEYYNVPIQYDCYNAVSRESHFVIMKTNLNKFGFHYMLESLGLEDFVENNLYHYNIGYLTFVPAANIDIQAAVNEILKRIGEFDGSTR